MGDLFAQIASVNTGERKIHEMIDRFGVDALTHGMYALMDYAEAQARAIVRAIPDGDYFFDEYADEDSAGGYPLRIALTVRVRGDSLVMDYTGTDPQLHSSLNIPTGGRERHVLATVGLVYVLYTLDPRLMLNAGILRVCRCILPEGTMLNPQHPGRGRHAQPHLPDADAGHLRRVLPGGAGAARRQPRRRPGDHQRQHEHARQPRRDGLDRPGRRRRRRQRHGATASEGSGANTCFLRNTPVEIIESEVPIHMRRYGLVPDSGGPGRFRGGCGTLMEFQVFAPNTVVTARNRDRSRFAAWGIRGGDAGASSRFHPQPRQRTTQQELGNTDVVTLDPGDILRVHGPGGGGYGPAWEREPRSRAPRRARRLRLGCRRPRALRRRHPRRRHRHRGHRLASRPPRASNRTGTISPPAPAAPHTNSS